MAKNYETGNAKNLANFDELIRNVKAFGDAYQPPIAQLNIDSLSTKGTAVREALNNVNKNDANYNIALAAKEEEFKPLKKLFTRVLNILKVLGLSQSIMEEATGLNRKMQGVRASAKLTAEEQNALKESGIEKKQISSSQQGIDNLIETFDKLIQLLITLPQYTPNEADLKLSSLTDLLATLKTKNSDTDDESVSLANARITRDIEMYADKTGMIAVALSVKNYVKAAFGASSTQYKQISGIEFRNVS